MLYLQCIFVFPEYKKARQDIKKAASDTIRLQKKVKKGQWGSYREMIFLFVKVKLQLFNSDFCIKVYFTYLLKAPAVDKRSLPTVHQILFENRIWYINVVNNREE